MIRIKRLLSFSLIAVLSSLLLFTLFQATSVPASSEIYTCDDLVYMPPFYEPCWGSDWFECDDVEYRSLCKLICHDVGSDRFLYCNPYP